MIEFIINYALCNFCSLANSSNFSVRLPRPIMHFLGLPRSLPMLPPVILMHDGSIARTLKPWWLVNFPGIPMVPKKSMVWHFSSSGVPYRAPLRYRAPPQVSRGSLGGCALLACSRASGSPDGSVGLAGFGLSAGLLRLSAGLLDSWVWAGSGSGFRLDSVSGFNSLGF